MFESKKGVPYVVVHNILICETSTNAKDILGISGSPHHPSQSNVLFRNHGATTRWRNEPHVVESTNQPNNQFINQSLPNDLIQPTITQTQKNTTKRWTLPILKRN